jgi:L-rhamnose mutarotase
MSFRAYRMRLKKDHISDYKEMHRKEKIWPEIVQCLLDSGMERMIIFQDGQDLILFEEAEDLEGSYRIQNADTATRKWDAFMSDWMENYPAMEGIDAADIAFEEVSIVYYFENGKLKH